MAKFGDWQKHLDFCLESLLCDSKQFELFKECKTDEERIYFVRESGVLKNLSESGGFEPRVLLRLLEVCGYATTDESLAEYLMEKPEIEDYLNITNDRLHRKSLDVAQLARKKGNKNFEKRNFTDALCCYNECILNAPPSGSDGNELSLGFANRSAVFLHLKNYQLCISDIRSALDNEYPANLRHKLSLRKAQCLARLGQWSEVKPELEQAREKYLQLSTAEAKRNCGFLKDIDELMAKVDENSAGNLSHVADVKKKVLPVPVGGFGAVLKQASAGIDMQHNSEKGRYIVANRKITAGDVLFVEQPYSAILLPSHYLINCHNCFAKVEALIPCCNCNAVVYCSHKCQLESWTSSHFIECPILNLLQSVGIAHLGLRIVLTAGLKTLLDFKDKVLTLPSKERELGLTSRGTYECNYLSMYHLMPHTDDMLVEDLYQYSLTASLLLSCLEKSDFFSLIENFEAKEASVLFVGGLLLRHICQLVCNAHAITDLELTHFSESSLVDVQNQVRVATAIYPTASLMNHSCDPTIISSFCNETLIVRAVKDVEAGQEVFNCYGPHCKRMARADRQQHLREQYFFDCRCEPCLNGITQELNAKSLKCCHCKGPLVDSKGEIYTCLECGKSRLIKDIPWNDLEKADNLFQAGQKLLEEDKIDDALSNFRSCLKTRRANLYRRNKDLSEAQDAVAKCYCVKGDFLSSYKLLRESIQTVEDIYGVTSIELANELQKFSDVCANAGELEDAISAAGRALKIFTTNYGQDSESALELRNFINLCLEARCTV